MGHWKWDSTSRDLGGPCAAPGTSLFYIGRTAALLLLPFFPLYIEILVITNIA
jgi:hypothetical protein